MVIALATAGVSIAIDKLMVMFKFKIKQVSNSCTKCTIIKQFNGMKRRIGRREAGKLS